MCSAEGRSCPDTELYLTDLAQKIMVGVISWAQLPPAFYSLVYV